MPPDTAPPAALGRGPWRGLPARGAAPSDEAVALLRLGLYTAALGLAFGLDLLVHGPAQGPLFWICGGGAAACLLLGMTLRGGLFRWGALAMVLVSVAVPLLPALARGSDPQAVTLWPQTLVALFASRVLAEDCDLAFVRFWQAPLAQRAPVRLQSGAAALALGLCLTLVFYQGLAWLAPARPSGTSFSAIVLGALTGETIIHRSIIVLFFVIVGYIVDAALHHRRDRAAFRLVQAALAARQGGVPDLRGLRTLVADELSDFTHLRAMRLIEEAYSRVEPRRSVRRALAASAFEGFELGVRRFVRALLPVLPMLGFFGTVVGLATAMAALPTSTPDGGGVDISGSLAGLAVKFQTTLLGLMASLIGASVIALLDKSETELGAECALLVSRIGDADGI